MSKDEDIGELLSDLAKSMRAGTHRKAGAGQTNVSEEQAKGWPEWTWPENEQSDQFKARKRLSERAQCAPGAAIAAHLKAEAEAE